MDRILPKLESWKIGDWRSHAWVDLAQFGRVNLTFSRGAAWYMIA
jgi:hypothetical protein